MINLPQRILLTGATGAVGSEVLAQLYPNWDSESITILIRPSSHAQKLVKKFPGIRVCYGSITSYTDVAAAMKAQDMVIHLAAVIPPAFDKMGEDAFRTNTEGTRNVVRAMEEFAPDAFLLYSSSVAVYGDRLKSPEIRVDDELPAHPYDRYADSKIASEEIIRNSQLNWSIFRLTAIMGVGNHKVSKLMFHMPLETEMEIATVKDTARALYLATQHIEKLSGKIFNLAGGKHCRISYEAFLTRAFDAFGLGKPNFPEYSFARANFHCGVFADSGDLEEILCFREDDIDSYFIQFRQAVPAWMRIATSLVRKPVKIYLGMLSEPRRAYKQNDEAKIAQYFGSSFVEKTESPK